MKLRVVLFKVTFDSKSGLDKDNSKFTSVCGANKVVTLIGKDVVPASILVNLLGVIVNGTYPSLLLT